MRLLTPRTRAGCLTDKQKRFAELVAGGLSRTQAYRRVYNVTGNSRTHRVEASRLARLQKVDAAIREFISGSIDGAAESGQISFCLYQTRHGKSACIKLNALKRLAKLNRLL